MKHLILFLPFFISITACASPVGIRPNHIPVVKQQEQLQHYFQYWEKKYVKTSSGKTPGGGFYVQMKGLGPDGEESITSSEAHGYGMMIYALMGNKSKFDGFFNMFHRHRSASNPYNMSWIIDKTEKKRYSSATDGDLDIAYALILAHQKWGSRGSIDYLTHAKNLIQFGIKKADFSASGRTNLGDWDRTNYHSRPSDWMPSHFQVFYEITKDRFWKKSVATVYDLVTHMQKNYAPRTGLLPDFIVDKNARPAPKNYLGEGSVDYSWNACRFPFRLALDFELHGRKEAKQSLEKGLRWVLAESGGNPDQIKAGYFLDGTPQVSYSDAAFVAPWIAAASIDSKYQKFMNKGWDHLVKSKSSYYSDTITLMVLIYLSNNWKESINPS